jgi:RHS repeat-associated protein
VKTKIVEKNTVDLFSNPINRPNTIQKTVIFYSPVLPKQPDMKLEKRSSIKMTLYFGNDCSDFARTHALRFRSDMTDNETGLMLYRNRVYHPTLGRFLQKDPIGYSAGDGNIYRYANNNTQSFYDFCGLQASNSTCPLTVISSYATRYASAATAEAKTKVIVDLIETVAMLCGRSITVAEALQLMKINEKTECKKEDKKPKEKCSEKYPGYHSCSGYGGSNAGALGDF